MLRELTRGDWLSILNLDEKHIPQTLILRGTRNLRHHFDRYRSLLDNPIDVASPNGLVEDVVVGQLNGINVGYASVYGPAMASEITHVFGKLGTRRVIQTGVCGGLGDALAAGDIVVATEAGCGEGAVACYLPDVNRISATTHLVEHAVNSSQHHSVQCGPIWTTAALLAEGMDDLQRWHAAGFLAVDMETATTFGVAEWLGMERVSVLSVFDNPLAGEHVALEEAHKAERRQAGEKAMLAVVMDLVSYGN